MNDKNKITRVDLGFRKEFDDIRLERKENDLGTLSDRKLTSLIIRWKHWGELKRELVSYQESINA